MKNGRYFTDDIVMCIFKRISLYFYKNLTELCLWNKSFQ